MHNPVNAAYLCPFIDSQCLKRSQRSTAPYPVCSVWGGATRRAARLVCVCPKRFYEVNFFEHVIEHCWIGPKPTNPKISYEVKMKGFGQVDFVIADMDDATHTVKNFVSVELQSVDITGSVEPAYNAIVSDLPLEKAPIYGFNWANVRKRFISQLIAKGFFHHQWGSRVVAVLQTHVYDEFRKYIAFDELPPQQGNIVFMLYDYVPAPEQGDGFYSLELKRVVSTSHNSLMTGSLYRTAPLREDFCKKIIQNIP